MVTTRGTLFQDQERQKRTLGSLRLHYFISNYRLRQIKMDPITPFIRRKLIYGHGARQKNIRGLYQGAAGRI